MEEVHKRKKGYLPIENYGVVGNLHTVALVSMQGSVDFMCFTRFDSPTIFGALLDKNKGGFFAITPHIQEVDYKQLYLPDTNILLTRILSDEGIAEITDFMPVKAQESNCALVRKVKAVRGSMRFQMRCQPRFDYGRASHAVEIHEKEGIFISKTEAQGNIRLMSGVKLTDDEGDICADFTLQEGEEAGFVLEAVSEDPHFHRSLEYYVNESFEQNIHFWRNWIGQCQYTGRWRETVNRSALTLKLLTSYQFGSIVAAPTFGLPESIGGGRNWDYRFTWIRDAAFTMYAFLKLGFMQEAHAFLKWLQMELENMQQDETLQLMYGVDGHTDLTESELPHWEGYKGSSPVRIGNGAFNQLQLDIYGELMDSIYLFNKYGGPITYDFWQHLERLINYVCSHWYLPDHGIWEIRDEKREFLQSRIMCWVALDRAIKVAESRSFPAPIERWRQVRNDIYQDIYFNFWNKEKQAYVQYKGSEALDASALLLPLVHFLSPEEPRWISTLKAMERELVSDSLVYRYRLEYGASDGLPDDEGTFTMCSFWYVEALSRTGRTEEARLHFEKTLGYANHLGLYAEQLGLRGQHLGNFPQAFNHLGLISAAIELDKKLHTNGKPVYPNDFT